jgi:hypothetical protein
VSRVEPLIGLPRAPVLLGKPVKIVNVLLGGDGVKLGGHDAPPWLQCAGIGW